MSVWTTPASASGGSTALTAAWWNAEARDHLNWLKGWADLITANSAADTGNTTYLRIARVNTTDHVLQGMLVGDSQARFAVYANGKVGWGPGGTTAPITFLDWVNGTVPALRLSGDSALSLNLSAVPAAQRTILIAAVTGDSYHRILGYIRTDGGGGLAIGNGGATKGTWFADEGSGRTYFGASGQALWFYSTAEMIFSDSLTGLGRITFTNDVASNWGIRFAGDVGATLYRPAAETVMSVVKLKSGGGIVLTTKAWAISDTDFPLPESGMIAVDTSTNYHLAVRSGTTWRTIDLLGSLVPLGPWTWTNLAASQSNLAGTYVGGTIYQVCPMLGNVIAISVRGTASCTAGSATFTANIGGVNNTNVQAVINTTNPVNAYDVVANGAWASFNAGTALAVNVTTDGTFAPATTEYSATLWVIQKRA